MRIVRLCKFGGAIRARVILGGAENACRGVSESSSSSIEDARALECVGWNVGDGKCKGFRGSTRELAASSQGYELD